MSSIQHPVTSIPKTEIISIGNELLSGLTVNTNASWIASQCHAIGLTVQWITTISDTDAEIEFALETASNRANVVICTGGLGPTPDDLTKNTICKFFDTKLLLHQETLEHVKEIFEGRHLKMPDINIGQAMIPEKATPLYNSNGTAPGLFFEQDGKLYFFLPGVPFEMKALVESQVFPVIKNKLPLPEIRNYLLRTTGIAESRLFEKLEPALNKYPGIQVAFLPNTKGIDLRFKSRKGEESAVKLYNEIKSAAEKYIFTEKEELLTEVIGRILIEKKLTLSTAESFTGGLISDWITDISGSSEYFIGGITTYSNESKMQKLGVAKSTLEQYGAVSEQTAREMVTGVKKLFNTDCAISSTGIAGPTGATDTKPVGLCFLAASYKDETVVSQFNFGKIRRINKERGAIAGLELLRRLVLRI